jgi:hypothetical protein
VRECRGAGLDPPHSFAVEYLLAAKWTLIVLKIPHYLMLAFEFAVPIAA